jgi:NitT/TauT family transport system permease protein
MLSVLRKVNKKLLSYYALVVFFALWEIAPKAGWADGQFLPPLSKVLVTGWQRILMGEIFISIAVSLQRTLIGFVLAIAIGIPLGFVLGGSLPKAAKFFNPLFTALSQVNPVTLIPVFIIIFGIGEQGKIAIIFWASIWPILFTTVAGVQQLDRIYIRAAKSMGANSVTIFFKVILPGASPSICQGMKTGLTMAFMMLIAAESIGADSGLGWIIHNSALNNTIPRMYAAILIIAIIGLLLNYVLEWLEKNLISWRQTAGIDQSA